MRDTLDNGLRVAIVRDTLAPVAAVTVNYLVGANETPPGFPGTAHAQEHMMFRGGPGLPADQLTDIASLMGGSFNAETLGLTRSDPDFYALRLGDTVLGGAFYASRFSRDIRKDAGLVHSIDSLVEAGRTRALYFIEYACDPANASRVQNAVARELEAMRATPGTPDELHRAKARLLHRSRRPLSRAITDITRPAASTAHTSP